jgi:glycosyltransferase involved in cell wall biosynthesis
MKIAVNTRLLLNNKLSGIGWFEYHVLKRLVEQHPEHQFIFLFDRSYDKQFIFGPNVIPEVVFPQARHPFLYYIWFNYSIVSVIKKHKANLFLSPDGLLSTRLPDIPSISVIHDINFHHYPMDVPFFMRHYYKFYFPKYAQLAKRIITVSEYSKNDISSTYNIDYNKIDVAYNGASQDYRPLDEVAKKSTKIDITGGNEYFLFVGNLLPRKNLARVIYAFSEFKKQSKSNTKLVIVGDMNLLSSELDKAFKCSDYKKDIVFTGRLPQDKLLQVMGSALALVFVSYFEGFGIPILEAMYSDVPVISSNTTSMPEVTGDAALLVDPYSVDSIKDAMLAMDKDKDLRQNLIEKGRIQRKNFTWNNTADAVWKSIEKALQ